MSAADARRFTIPVLLAAALAGIAAWLWPAELAPLRRAAILLAWGGTTLLAASLVLILRQPRLAHWLGGIEQTYRWHHRCGVSAYLLLLAHPLALAFDGWTQSPQAAWLAITPWTPLWEIWLGWLSLTLLMFGLATTFALRLAYRRWRLLHYSLGVGVLAGFAHVIALVGPLAPALLLTATGLAALAWRVVAGDFGATASPYRVASVLHPAATMVEATLVPQASALHVEPGQFVLTAFEDGERFHGCREFHPFTVSGIEAGGRLRVAIKALGPCSAHLQSIEPGVAVRVQGPFGNFLAGDASLPQLWIAGGIGITPFIAMLRAGRCHTPTTLLYLVRERTDAAFVDELGRLQAADRNLAVQCEATGNGLPDAAPLLDAVAGMAGREVRICGPAPMVDALLPLLQARGVPAQRIQYERFDFR